MSGAFAYIATRRRLRQVILAAAVHYFVVAAVGAMVLADLIARQGRSWWPVLAAMLAGWLAAEMLSRRFGHGFLPESRLSNAMLASAIALAWLVRRPNYPDAVAVSGLLYLSLFWFSNAVESLLGRLSPRRRRFGVFAVYTLVFAGGLVGGAAVGGALVWVGRAGGTVMIAGVVLLAAGWAATVATRYRRAPAGPMQWFLFQFAHSLATLWHGLRIARPARLPRRGAIVVATHVSAIDPLLLQVATRRVLHWLVAREYFYHWTARLTCAITASVPVSRSGRDTAATRQALRLLERGEVVAIFPHGRIRSGPDDRPAIKHGAALLALMTDAPVVPACVLGAEHTSVPGDWLRPHRDTFVLFGPPVDLADLRGQRRTRPLIAEASRRIQAALDQLAGGRP